MQKQHHGMKVLKRMLIDKFVRNFQVKGIINDTWQTTQIWYWETKECPYQREHLFNAIDNYYGNATKISSTNIA